jgi:hypothetical protein
MRVWDVESGKELTQIPQKGNPDVSALSEDGKLLVVGTYELGRPGMDTLGRLTLWDARAGNRLGEPKGHRGFFGRIGFSPDGQLLVCISGSDHTLRMWDTTTQKEVLHYKNNPRACFFFAFRRDSRVLALAGLRPEVVFLEAPSGKELAGMPTAELAKKQPFGIRALHFLPDGKRLITTDAYGQIFIWERDTGRLVKEWYIEPCCVSRLTLSADGKTLLTRGANTVLVWDLDALLR